MRDKLTALMVDRATKPGYYGDGANLWLKVRPDGRKSWQFRFTLAGKSREMGLGSAKDVSLAKARNACREARELVRLGVDPIEAGRAKKRANAAKVGLNTFREVAEAYIAAHEAGWRNAKHRQQWRNTLETYAYPVIGKLAVATIETGDVTRVLEPIWREKPETASRLRGRIESVLDYAAVRGWRSGDNPARWKGHLDHILPSRAEIAPVEHHAALGWRDIGGFMAALRQREGSGAGALEFLILTAARSGEVRGARWGEVDLDNGVWIIPGERMKAGKEHRVPLSDAALAMLRAVRPEQPDPEALVFPGANPGKPLSDMSLTAVLRRMGKGELTAHGFRSTFRDWCAEATNYPRELADAALAHTKGDKTEKAYWRGDLFEKRRRLMQEWAAFCERAEPATGAVVPLRA